MTKYVQLQTGQVLPVNSMGYVTVPIEIDINDCVQHSSSWVKARISQLAIGSVLLQDMSYKVVGHRGNLVKMLVTGSIHCIGARHLDLDEIPEAEYEVEITRVSYGTRTIRLSARSSHDAAEIADDDAGNHLYTEHGAEYQIDVTPVPA